jgi:hypothetical protein
MSILEIEEECRGNAQSKYCCWYNLHIPEGPLLLKSPQTTGMGEVSLGEKHFTGLKLRHLEKIAG